MKIGWMKMRVIETIMHDFITSLDGKKVLEIACGDSDFSLAASKYAKEVLATDISLERVKKKNLEVIPKNIRFKEMNAANLDIDSYSFDVSACYNGLGHLKSILRPVLMEMIRVTIEGGYLIFIATWKMDKEIFAELKNIINEHNNVILYSEIECNKYSALIVKKGHA
jgi:ubiquinone/menaquinone biosynthesis C-methylase UbiE